MKITLHCLDHNSAICADDDGLVGQAVLTDFVKRHETCYLVDRSDDEAALDRLIQRIITAQIESEVENVLD